KIMPCSLDAFPALARFVSGVDAPWSTLEISGADLLQVAEVEELAGVLHDRYRESSFADSWPANVGDVLSADARLHAALELAREHEIRGAIAALAAAGVVPILLKGTALAYTVYKNAGSRRRQDTDLLVRAADEKIGVLPSARSRILRSEEHTS